MALSNDHRWILIGHLRIRKRSNAGEESPDFSLEEVIFALRTLIDNESNYHMYGRQSSKLLWASDLENDFSFYHFLMNVGDKAVSAPSFVNFSTKDTREVEKSPREGTHYNSHVIIRKQPDSAGLHQILVEKVPSIYFGTIKRYLTWISKETGLLLKKYEADDKEKEVRPIFEFLGNQSNTIGEALKTGILKDIKFVGSETDYTDGHDEEGIVQDVIREAKFKVGKRIPEDKRAPFFSRISGYYKDFKQKRDDAHFLIKIETSSGQQKTTLVEGDKEGAEILEQAFIQNEKVQGFMPGLSQRHDGIRKDMIQKMIALAKENRTADQV